MPEQQMSDRNDEMNEKLKERDQQVSEGAAKREELISQMSVLIQQKEVW